jgi:predicted dehydrogenase
VDGDVIRLGLLGMSEGNGHPYSWAAICNGYDATMMAECPFPTIGEYLAPHRLPAQGVVGARVTSVWTQDRGLSAHIAATTHIPSIVVEPREMVGAVDGILLARDDAENHRQLSAPFLEAGLPVYIDKPLALTSSDAQTILDLEQYPGQVFSCSALRYAPEFGADVVRTAAVGDVARIDGTVGKDWDRYAVHVIEPALALLGFASTPVKLVCRQDHKTRILAVDFADGRSATFTAHGGHDGHITLDVLGASRSRRLTFTDSFTAFRTALQVFVDSVVHRTQPIPRPEMLAVISLVEAGRHPS